MFNSFIEYLNNQDYKFKNKYFLRVLQDEDPNCIEGVDSIEYVPNLNPEDEVQPYSPFLSLS